VLPARTCCVSLFPRLTTEEELNLKGYLTSLLQLQLNREAPAKESFTYLLARRENSK
jgi:hypothetical protein